MSPQGKGSFGPAGEILSFNRFFPSLDFLQEGEALLPVIIAQGEATIKLPSLDPIEADCTGRPILGNQGWNLLDLHRLQVLGESNFLT